MEEEYYLGIDVSKGYADFVMLDSKKQRVDESYQLDDTFEGHHHLYRYLERFYKEHPGARVHAAVESTGGYENNWLHSLLQFQSLFTLETARLNPLGVHANSRADMKRNITDRISAQSIAEYLISHPEKVSYQNQDSLSGLRKQWGFIRMLNKQKTQLLDQLESLLYRAHPELLRYCRDGKPEWVLRLLVRYPTAGSLSRARAASVARIPYISLERAKELMAGAKKSVASSGDAITGQLISATAKQILNLKKLIASQLKIMAKECPVPEVELLKTFPGISDASAIGLMLQIQSIERFPSVKKLASFFGLHPVFKVSGDGASGFHMSKQGSREVRRILFMVVLNAILCNPLIRELYQDRVQRGMNKMAAIGLCMHKTLRIIYGMLKNNRAFDAEIDRKNRGKMLKAQGEKKKKNGSFNKTRRYQDFDPKAPISKRQTKKRREWEQSHSVHDTKRGISAPTPSSV